MNAYDIESQIEQLKMDTLIARFPNFEFTEHFTEERLDQGFDEPEPERDDFEHTLEGERDFLLARKAWDEELNSHRANRHAMLMKQHEEEIKAKEAAQRKRFEEEAAHAKREKLAKQRARVAEEQQALLADLVTPGQEAPASDPEFVEGLLRLHQNSILSGTKNAGKTHVAMELGRCVSTGEPFFGRQTRKGAVLYLAYEGLGAVHERMRAWEGAGLPTSNQFHAVNTREWPFFSDEDDAFRDRLVRMIDALADLYDQEVSLVVIDTLKAATPGNSEEVTGMDDAARLSRGLCEDLGVHVMLVQHSTKDGKSVRGHSALTGDANTVLMAKEGSGRTARSVMVTHQRQGEANMSLGEYDLVEVETGVELPGFNGDGDGRPEISVYVQPRVSGPGKRAPVAKLDPVHKEFADRLRAHLVSSDDGTVDGAVYNDLVDQWLQRHFEEDWRTAWDEDVEAAAATRDKAKDRLRVQRRHLKRAMENSFQVVVNGRGHVDHVKNR